MLRFLDHTEAGITWIHTEISIHPYFDIPDLETHEVELRFGMDPTGHITFDRLWLCNFPFSENVTGSGRVTPYYLDSVEVEELQMLLEAVGTIAAQLQQKFNAAFQGDLQSSAPDAESN